MPQGKEWADGAEGGEEVFWGVGYVKSFERQPVGSDLCLVPLSPVSQQTEELVKHAGMHTFVPPGWLLLLLQAVCRACRHPFALICRLSCLQINQFNFNQLNFNRLI